MDPPPPPPPPHGENPKSTSGLPQGKYDIFIIPPHSSGSGFLYLPSLQPNTNSFAAGFASALILVALGSAIWPIAQSWFSSVKNSGGVGMMLVSVGLAIGAWAVGRMQNEGGFSGKSSGNGRGDASAGAPPGGPPPHGGGAGQNGYTPGSGAHSRNQSHGAGYSGGGGGPTPSGNGYTGEPGGWGNNAPPPKPNGWQQRDEAPPQPQPQPGAYTNTPPPNTGYNTGSTPNNHNASSNAPPPPRPKPERSQPSGWERAREETRRKEEERRRAAELQRQKEETERKLRAKKEEAERKLNEAREKERLEREAREAARERIAREAREARAARDAKLAAEKKAKEEAALREQREKEAAAKKAAEAEAKAKAEMEERRTKAWAAAKIQAAIIEEKKRKAAEAAEAAASAKSSAAAALNTERRQGSSYAYSATGEKTNPWPRGYPTAPASVSATATATSRAAPGSAAAAAASRNSPSPTKRPTPSPSARPAPTPPNAKSYAGTEDTYSYRPYDAPKRPAHSKAPSSIFSGTSYAESDTTSATSAPPSMRGAYSTKDPDKIVMKAVYSFNNAHTRTPVTQLVSGTGSVTDGLILRITTEGLFIDDDVRHVPQREWDIKAWTLKLVEVGCPCFPNGFGTPPLPEERSFFGNNAKKAMHDVWQGEPADKKLEKLLGACKGNCRLGLSPSSIGSGTRKSQGSQADNRSSQTGQSAKLHVLRASIRDQEGKKYVFVIGEEEGWKIAVGLQRIRRGTQVRSLGVQGLSKSDCASTLTNLGWA